MNKYRIICYAGIKYQTTNEKRVKKENTDDDVDDELNNVAAKITVKREAFKGIALDVSRMFWSKSVFQYFKLVNEEIHQQVKRCY